MYLVKIRKGIEIRKKKVFPLKPVPDIQIEIDKSRQKKGSPFSSLTLFVTASTI